jgi:hypothetical protein
MANGLLFSVRVLPKTPKAFTNFPPQLAKSRYCGQVAIVFTLGNYQILGAFLQCFSHDFSKISVRMKEFSLPNVSVASSGDEYFQVHFSDKQDSDDAYFLIQRQFESPDGGHVYVESNEQTLCGHFKIKSAALRRDVLHLEIICPPTETVQIRFKAGARRYNLLKTVLKTMIPSIALDIE